MLNHNRFAMFDLVGNDMNGMGIMRSVYSRYAVAESEGVSAAAVYVETRSLPPPITI